MLTRIDHLVVPVPDLVSVAGAYERLGLVLTPFTEHAGMGTANRAFFVGSSPETFAYFELLAITDAAIVRDGSRRHYLQKAEAGGGVASLAFGVDDMAATVALFAARGMAAELREIHATDGRKVGKAAVVDTAGVIPFGIALLQYPETWDARYERSVLAGRFNHTFPLKRLDHVAAVSTDLEGDTALWESLGAKLVGEIPGSVMVIRQLKIGDAIFELLASASPDGPMASRPAGLASVAAWEVDGALDDAVALARERGFTASDPEPGVIPGTRRATIAANELGGAAMQLLEYV